MASTETVVKNSMTEGTESSSETTSRLTAKDIVILAVFSVITFLIFMVVSMVCSFSPNMAWWTHSIGAIPGGIVWMYLMAKVRKTGAAFIAGAIMALLGFLMGMLWTGPLGMVIGAALCEVIMVAGKRSKISAAIGFAVFVLCWWFGQISLIIFAGQEYVEMIVAMGMTAEYGQGLIDWVASPMFPVAAVATVVGALLGSYLGQKVFHKHFAKISSQA